MDITCKAGCATRSKLFFYLGVGILTVKVLFMYSDFFAVPEWADRFFVIFGVSCLIMKIVFQQYTFLLLVFWVGLGCISCICAFCSRDYTVLLTMLVICAFQQISIESFIREIFKIKCFFLWIHIVLYVIRLWLHPEVLTFNLREGMLRHTFGMNHANIFSMIITWMILEWTYIHYEKIKIRNLVAIQIMGFIVYGLTFSRTGLLVLTLAVFLSGIAKCNRNLDRIFIVGGQWSYLILAMLSLLIMYFYFDVTGEIGRMLQKLNQILTGRLNMWATAYQLYGTSICGQIISENGKVSWDEVYRITQVIVDNTYVYLAVKCGGIFLGIFGGFFFWTAGKGSVKMALMILAFSVFNSMESFGGSIFLSFPLCFIGYGLYQNIGGKNEDEKNETKESQRIKINYRSKYQLCS